MITVQEALEIIEKKVTLQSVVSTSIHEAINTVLAKDIKAPISMPPFRQSSMDGYALKLSSADRYTVIGEVQAGSSQDSSVKEGEAVRIFTGAPVPVTADTVVMQESVQREGDVITFNKRPEINTNIRPMGEQLKIGEIALTKGTLLNAAGLGFLAGLGISNIEIYKQPSVSILITGDELQQPGSPLKKGQVYDSNSVTIKAALMSLGLSQITVDFIKDDYETTQKIIKKHINSSDVVLISGGISVGDYDFVRDALLENKVKEHFYKVNQKPGKPLWFGTTPSTTVFALPGNPASSLTCFYVYVLPALRRMMGHKNIHLAKHTGKTTINIKNRFGKTLFLKGNAANDEVTPLLGQASSMLKSFAVSNALIIIPETTSELKKGDTLSYLDLTS